MCNKNDRKSIVIHNLGNDFDDTSNSVWSEHFNSWNNRFDCSIINCSKYVKHEKSHILLLSLKL